MCYSLLEDGDEEPQQLRNWPLHGSGSADQDSSPGDQTPLVVEPVEPVKARGEGRSVSPSTSLSDPETNSNEIERSGKSVTFSEGKWIIIKWKFS